LCNSASRGNSRQAPGRCAIHMHEVLHAARVAADAQTLEAGRAVSRHAVTCRDQMSRRPRTSAIRIAQQRTCNTNSTTTCRGGACERSTTRARNVICHAPRSSLTAPRNSLLRDVRATRGSSSKASHRRTPHRRRATCSAARAIRMRRESSVESPPDHPCRYAATRPQV